MTWPPPSIDPLIRRAVTPPAAGDVRQDGAARRRTSQARRPSVARVGRISSVALSVAATGGLTWSFARADQQAAVTQDAPGTAAEGAATGTSTPGTAAVDRTTAVPHSASTPTIAPTSTTAPVVTTSTTTPDTVAPGTVAPTTVTAAATGVTGTFTGQAIPTRYGPVQVQVTYTNGQITDVTALRYPTSNRKDRAINARALPVLRREALSAQSADVHSVSGATYTSDGYATSLQSAIDAATAGG